MFLGWSSCVYPLDAADFATVPDYDGPPIADSDLPEDKVILLLRKGCPDQLVRGRAVITAAGNGTVKVRLVFVPTIAKWNLLFTLTRTLRNRRRFKGSGVYHIETAALRQMGLERAVRTLDQPHLRSGSDRKAYMRQLEESLRTNGYDDKRPVNVMLCRTRGEDSLRQGHHRISACLACGIPKMAISFSAAGFLPRLVRRALGRSPLRVDVLKSSLETTYGKPIRRLVPLGDNPIPNAVIVVPEAGGRFVLNLVTNQSVTVGVARAILVPLLVAGALVMDIAVLKTACGGHSFVVWSQFVLSGVAGLLMGTIAFRERRGRAAYGALAFAFLSMSVYELLRDVELCKSIWVEVTAVIASITVTLAAMVCRWRTFVTGLRRITMSRGFPALPFGAVLIWGISKIVSSRVIWGALGLTEHDVKTVKHIVEESTELLGYAVIAFWTLSFFWERFANWRRRR